MSLGRLRGRVDRLERSRSAANAHINSDFPIDPRMATQLRDDEDRLGAILRKQSSQDEFGGPPNPAELEEAERLKTSIAERVRAIECPLSYGPIRARDDSNRLHQLWCKRMSPPLNGGGPFNAMEDAEEAQVRARLLAFEARPEERKGSPAELKEEEYLLKNHPMRESIEAWGRAAKEAEKRPVRRRDDR
jgi:hypothetical protein